MTFTLFVIDTTFGLLTMLFLLRAWLQLVRADFHNPFSQFIVRFTQPLVGRLRTFIPAIGRLDTPTILLAYLMFVVKILLILAVDQKMLVFPPSTLLFALIMLFKAIGKLIFWVFLLRALLSWVSQGNNPVEYIMIQLSEPVLAPIRRLLPNTGGLDFSIMIAMFLLIASNYLITDLLGLIGLSQLWIN